MPDRQIGELALYTPVPQVLSRLSQPAGHDTRNRSPSLPFSCRPSKLQPASITGPAGLPCPATVASTAGVAVLAAAATGGVGAAAAGGLAAGAVGVAVAAGVAPGAPVSVGRSL